MDTWRTSTKIDITEVNKAKALVALYENAKKSEGTKERMIWGICPDPGLFHLYDMSAEIAQIPPLTEQKAAELLNEKLLCEGKQYIYSIGADNVRIAIDFSTNILDVEAYDNAHKSKLGKSSSTAFDVLRSLGAKLESNPVLAATGSSYIPTSQSYTPSTYSLPSRGAATSSPLNKPTTPGIKDYLIQIFKISNFSFISAPGIFNIIKFSNKEDIDRMDFYAQELIKYGLSVEVKPGYLMMGKYPQPPELKILTPTEQIVSILSSKF